MLFMPSNLNRPNDNGELERMKRNRRFTRSLAGALLLVGIQHALPARSANITNTYSVTLSWQPSPSLAIAGYRLYSGVVSGLYLSSVEVGNLTTNTVVGLVRGTTYFFAITAYDTNGSSGKNSAPSRKAPRSQATTKLSSSDFATSQSDRNCAASAAVT